ncbi:MAG: FAD/NAD(P)-binding protein [Flavobacteriales bacterium]
MRVAIIGGGLSGTLAAMRLLRCFGNSVHITLIERRSRQLNRGVAYSAHLSQQLLNVPAGRMGLFPEEVDGFLKWTKAGPMPDVQPGEFLPRRLYGDFVHDQFHDLIERHPRAVEIVRTEAVAMDQHPANGAVITLRDDRIVRADVVLLAMGNAPPAHLPGLAEQLWDHPRYVPWPWKHGALAEIGTQEHVVFVGSGLTMVDVLLSLRDHGHTGQVTVVSRRGSLPRPHTGSVPYSLEQAAPEMEGLTALRLWSWVRREVELAAKRGLPWQSVMDAVKPNVQEWWQALPQSERSRFLRHARPYWEVHRHRMPAPVFERLLAMEATGEMRRIAGRVRNIRATADGMIMDVLTRGEQGKEELHVHRIINCTGPQSDTRRMEQPLLKNLLHMGLATWDPLHMGLHCAPNGALIDAGGRVSDTLFAVGPLCKATLWESTAVPEIREQVANLVDLLVRERAVRDRSWIGRLFDRLSMQDA